MPPESEEDPMPKLAEKQATKFVAARAVTTQPSLLPVNAASTKIRKEDGERLSKQARVVEMLIRRLARP
jgi:hypothetical protein